MIFWGCLVFSREFGRPKTAKTKIYFTFGASVVLLSSSFVVAVVVPTGCRWCRVQGLPVSCGVCSVPLSLPLSLCCFAPDVLGLNMALFRILRGFLEGFMGFVWVCIVLVLCVDCVGFCARVELGGLKACGVFASRFLSFASFFLLL